MRLPLPYLHCARRAVTVVALLASASVAASQPTSPSQNTPAALHGDSLGDGGPAIRAKLVTPTGLARDAQGNIYFTERGAHRVRRVDARTGIITTFAGTGEAGYSGDGGPANRARFTQPDGIVVDRDGNVIIADVFNDRVRRVDPRTGIITTIAGTGEGGFSGDGGPATQAMFNGPFGLSLDLAGNLYITDTENHRIRRVDARTGIVTTVAGNGVWDFAGDGGQARDASFARPHIVLAEGDSALIIGDSFNFRIRRIDLRTGIIRTIAGTGERGSSGDGGPATSAAITYMGGLALMPNGDVLVSSLAEQRIRRIDRRTGVISPVAGTGRWAFDGDGGPATSASLHLPLTMLVDSIGTILFTDLWNGRVRRIDGRTGQITTIVGSALSPRTPAVGYHFHYHRDSLRKLLDEPVRYTIDGAAQVRVTRNVAYGARELRYRRFDVYEPLTPGVHPAVVLIPGRNDAEVRLKDSGGFESWARLIAASGLTAIVLDHSLGTQGRSLVRAGDDLVAALDYVTRNPAALRIDTSRVCVMAFSSAAPLLTRVLDREAKGVRCAAGYYPQVDLTREDVPGWFAEARETRQQYSLAPVLIASSVPTLFVRAGRDAPAINAPIDSLRARLAGRQGFTLLEHPDAETGFERSRSDANTRAVVRATLCFLQRSVRVPESQCASAADGSARDTVGDGGPATDAFLDRPASIVLDANENIYIGEQRSHRVRRVDARTGVISTVVGNGVPGSAGDGGHATRAQTNYPKLAVDRAGNLYVGEVNGYRIRRVDAQTRIITTVAGTGVQGFSGDGGPAIAARITRPFGLAFDRDGSLYFTDTEVNRVRRIDARTGIITTVAGTGRYEFAGDGGPATAASLARPHVLAFDPAGNLIIGDSFNQRIRRVDRRTGIITTIAGVGYRGVAGDGGPATAASFVYFGGLAYDTSGHLLVSGVGDHRVRRIDARTGIIRPFAGSGRWESNGDGGQAIQASFHPALELAVNARNDVYLVDAFGGRIRKIDGKTGVVTTVAGNRPPSPQPGDFHVHFDEAAIARLLDTPVALDLPGSRDARVREGLDYTGTGDTRRKLDIYTPAASPEAPLGVVVLVHGSTGTDLARVPTQQGAWTSRARALAAAGFAGVMFSHRLNQEGGLDRAAADLTTAISYLRAHAGELGIDANRICVVAFADGVPLLTELVRRQTPGIRCLTAFAPVVDLRASQAPFWLDSTAVVRSRFSFAAAVGDGARVPPTLVLMGARDAAAVTAPARALAGRARSDGLQLELLEHPEGGATFDRGMPGPETDRLLKEWVAFLQRWLR